MANIVVHTCDNPEDNAMLQALYSRSPASVTNHLAKVEAAGSGNFMERFYLGYGHDSVGDLGDVTVYFEGVSMLAAKALEDHPLFNGQECSSRYIDFSNQPFYNPYPAGPAKAQGKAKLEALRAFYVKALPLVKEHIKAQHPYDGSVSEGQYEKTVAARAFDICRGYLPCAATTNVAVKMSLRIMSEHLIHLMHHPLTEVAELAAQAYHMLHERYPHSFKPEYANFHTLKDTDLQNAIWDLEGEEQYGWRCKIEHFYEDQDLEDMSRVGGGAIIYPDYDLEIDAFPTQYFRPKRSKLPRYAWETRNSLIDLTADIDFGSFRDLHRHRNWSLTMPVVDPSLGFHAWYVDQLPESLREEARGLLLSTQQKISGVLDLYADQYFAPMATLVSVSALGNINQFIYVTELRTSKTVHPTLRNLMLSVAEELNEHVKLYFDRGEDDWTLKRGAQDIVEQA